jgi:hypothetical protein
MELELHQLTLRYERLRKRQPRAERALLVSLTEIGQQLPVIVIAEADRFVAGVNYFFRRRQLFLPVLSLHHWSTIAQSDAKGVRSSGSEFSSMLRS